MRTEARELALKALYQSDLLGEPAVECVEEFCSSHGPAECVPFAMRLVRGCLETMEELDLIIQTSAEHWKIARMPIIDRNILRLGAYEMLFFERTPPKVAMNEAIELAKKYGAADSPTFVNGVLDRIYSSRLRTGEGESEPGAAKASHQDCDCPQQHAGSDKRADLHAHSTESDGSVAPSELPEMAARAGLAALALTDHDSVRGIASAMRSAREVGICLVPGVELTAYTREPGAENDREVHILGLFIDPDCPSLKARLEHLRTVRVERIREMCSILCELGADIDAESVLARAEGDSVTRVHVAQEMVRTGACESLETAFERYIGGGRPAYVPKEKLNLDQAIAMVKDAGGCAALAHPDPSAGDVELLEKLKAKGLDAVEVHYPFRTEQQQQILLGAARHLDLAVSGGSDFHGAAKPLIGMGQETISMDQLHSLQQRATVGRAAGK